MSANASVMIAELSQDANIFFSGCYQRLLSALDMLERTMQPGDHEFLKQIRGVMVSRWMIAGGVLLLTCCHQELASCLPDDYTIELYKLSISMLEVFNSKTAAATQAHIYSHINSIIALHEEIEFAKHNEDTKPEALAAMEKSLAFLFQTADETAGMCDMYRLEWEAVKKDYGW